MLWKVIRKKHWKFLCYQNLTVHPAAGLKIMLRKVIRGNYWKFLCYYNLRVHPAASLMKYIQRSMISWEY